MDLAIRNATDNTATLADYATDLNTHNGTVTHDVLTTYLHKYGAHEFVPRFTEYVTQTTTITPAREVNTHNMYPPAQSRLTDTITFPPTRTSPPRTPPPRVTSTHCMAQPAQTGCVIPAPA